MYRKCTHKLYYQWQCEIDNSDNAVQHGDNTALCESSDVKYKWVSEDQRHKDFDRAKQWQGVGNHKVEKRPSLDI